MFILGLNVIFVPIIWVSFGFRPSKKKNEKRPCKKNCLKNVSDPTSAQIWHGSCHMAVTDCATFVTWR